MLNSDLSARFAPNYSRIIRPATEVLLGQPVTYVATEDCWVKTKLYGYDGTSGSLQVDGVVTAMCHSSSNANITCIVDLIPVKKGQVVKVDTAYSTLKSEFIVFGC